MAVRSVYLPAPQARDGCIHLTGDEHHHLTVARAEPGEPIEVFDGKGGIWSGVVESIGKRETVARITVARTIPPDPVELIAALALIRVGAFELALEKIVEVGVSRIVPFTADRSNAAGANRHERWSRILIEAAKQSKQYVLPVLERPVTFDEVVAVAAASKILFAEREGRPLKSALAGSPVLYLVGPEGGWTDREMSKARDCGFQLVSLGAAILKAETAAIVGTSLIRYELGR
jgi:16S rRNA (uracil1498-N3)-methyltransferase